MSYATPPLGDPFDKALEDVTQALEAYQQNIAETLEALEEIAATEIPADDSMTIRFSGGEPDYSDQPEPVSHEDELPF